MFGDVASRLQKKLGILSKLQSQLKTRKRSAPRDFTGIRKQNQLVLRWRKLSRKVIGLQYQLKLASVGGAVALFMKAESVQAQTSIGPFTELTGIDNPLHPPIVKRLRSKPAFIDFDLDGDSDLVLGQGGLDFYGLSKGVMVIFFVVTVLIYAHKDTIYQLIAHSIDD